MNNFYFTFGTEEEQPFYGGWVKVIADDLGAACEKFRERFPNPNSGFLNCAASYTEEQFKKTRMDVSGNFGFYCHEVIE